MKIYLSLFKYHQIKIKSKNLYLFKNVIKARISPSQEKHPS